MSKTMKALQITCSTTSSATLSLNTLPIPTLKPGHALVKINYACIHPSDRLNAQGLFPSTTLPRIPGRDFSGTVVEISESDKTSTSKSWIGKQVYGTSGSSLGFTSDGPHAQYCLIPHEALVEKPSSLSALQAATVGVPFTTALICLQRAQVKSDDIVLVLGATGAVGSTAVQIARAMGCRRVLTAARRAEPTTPDILLSGENPAAELALRLAELTGGKGVDVVVDTVGDVALMDTAVELLARKGRYTWIAAPRGDVSKMVSFDIFQAYRKEITLVGCNSVSPTIGDAAGLLRSLGGWIEQGVLRAQDEGSFRKVRIENCVDEGYGRAGEQVVIEME
jgi:NADPH:quinone reductase-like Zn-dependent oxidoreductase